MNTDAKQQIPDALVDSVGEELPTFTEIERYARDGVAPKCCQDRSTNCAAKILFALTRKTYPSQEAEKIWRAIMEHETWLVKRLGRRTGISVAALDYLMNVSGEFEEAVVAEADQINNLTDAATLDGLTGLYVREIFDSWLEKSVAESRRYGAPLSLLMADIDDFKMINDTHGHQVGDEVLMAIGSDFRENLRSADFAARYGGEELVAVLPHTGLRSAFTVAEKIRRTVHERYAANLGVSISIGAACWRNDMHDPADLVEAADDALYEAKGAGKNCVMAAAPD